LGYNSNMNNNKNTTGRKPILSDVVMYDGRSQGPQRGVITRVVRVKSYYPGKADLVYFQISGVGCLIPAADITAVL